ncbi:unnamed protein product [Pleuronectes platessa]|uniref:Uncharacterized protein n=1 Tax=Pleuronectes platessa TaxID=8262 RepID=A0A9N7Z3D4_PLEPL|nr:unnamed protein product [Pleuronectes platessa]
MGGGSVGGLTVIQLLPALSFMWPQEEEEEKLKLDVNQQIEVIGLVLVLVGFELATSKTALPLSSSFSIETPVSSFIPGPAADTQYLRALDPPWLQGTSASDPLDLSHSV